MAARLKTLDYNPREYAFLDGQAYFIKDVPVRTWSVTSRFNRAPRNYDVFVTPDKALAIGIRRGRTDQG